MDVHDSRASVDGLLDLAVAAINRGDRDTATSLAEQVLTADHGNADAEDLLAVTGDPGEFRRLTMPYSKAFGDSIEAWVSLEPGDFDRSARIAEAFTVEAGRCGFEQIRLWGVTQQAAAHALTSLSHRDSASLPSHIEAIAGLLDEWRAGDLNLYITCHVATLAKLLVAAGHPIEARDQIDAELRRCDETEMTFYNAELLRIRAATTNDPEQRRADLAAARSVARCQDAMLFELRAALDDFEARGEPARDVLLEVVDRMPADVGCPELQVARIALASTP